MTISVTEELTALKSELKQYVYLTKQKQLLEEDYIIVCHQLESVGGPKYDGMPRIASNPLAVSRITILDVQKKAIESEYQSVVLRLRKLSSILASIEPKLRKQIKALYVYRSTTLETLAVQDGVTKKAKRYEIDYALLDAMRKRRNAQKPVEMCEIS